MPKSLAIFALTALLFISFSQIGNTTTAPLKVVVSIAPLEALTQGILGEKGTVAQIVPANMSPHSYTLKPRDLKTLLDADVILWIGPQLEFFLNKSIIQLKSSKKIITIADLPGLTLLKARVGANWQDDDHHHLQQDNAQPLSLDPHLWLDPDNAAVILKSISVLLAQLDPENKNYYTKQLQQRLMELAEQDKEISQQLAAVKNKPYLVFHDGYQYFEKHYHLTDLGTVMINPEVPLSGKQLLEIQAKIKNWHVVCVFKEPQTNERLADTVIRGTQAKLGLLDPLDSGLPAGWQGYSGLLHKNTEALIECLMH